MWFRWAVASTILLVGCGGKQAVVVEGESMAMRWRIQVVGGNERGLKEEVTRVMGDWELATSLWREDSELTRFNRASEGSWVKLGEKLWSAVAMAREVARETDGFLDITVGPLVELWGFGSGVRRVTVPTEEEVQGAMRRCGWRQLEFDEEGRSMRKLTAGVEVNVNSVVEGLVLEDLARCLKAMGHRDFMLELGGELVAEGQSGTGKPWMAAVQVPGGAEGESFSMMPLSGFGLATSGTYRHHYMKDGVEISHLIDPTNGHPVKHRLTSVSVFDARCGRADGYATALMVMGHERGREVANRLGLRVIWIETED